MSTGLILFGHGARDPRWREPFDQLERMVAARHDGPVSLAFLELMEPDLTGAARALAQKGAMRVVVVPLFFGTGGHIRRDLPSLIEAAAVTVGISIQAIPPAGEDPDILEALARYCLLSPGRSTN